jgi:LysM repeat protein
VNPYGLAPSGGDGEPKTHKLEEGETLSHLSEKYGVSVEELYVLNPNVKGRERNLHIGEEIIIQKPKENNISKGETKAIIKSEPCFPDARKIDLSLLPSKKNEKYSIVSGTKVESEITSTSYASAALIPAAAKGKGYLALLLLGYYTIDCLHNQTHTSAFYYEIKLNTDFVDSEDIAIPVHSNRKDNNDPHIVHGKKDQ